ncbi:MAG: tyrosine-type recombinase/integrase [Pseudobdellovibrio sp.]
MKNRNRAIDEKIEKYHRSSSKGWGKWTKLNSRSILYQFHLWAKANKIQIRYITDSDLKKFGCELAEDSRKNYLIKARRYVRWLGGEKLKYTRSTHWLGWSRGKPNPHELEKFLKYSAGRKNKKTLEKYESSLRRFHTWLEQKGVAICRADESHLLDFSRALYENGCQSYNGEKNIQQLRVYLYWLHANGVVKLSDPSSCRRERKSSDPLPVKLPAYTVDFLNMMTTYLKIRTVQNYQTTLKRFHIYLNREGIPLIRLKRKHMEGWLIYLEQESLGATWRRSLLIRTKIYLYWLHEHGKITAEPDSLLKRGDLPKRPQYLPKPLRPEDDLKLQSTLKSRSEMHCKALLLMRWTGLRIGELTDLPYNCVWTDHADRHFLKVPLGKLNNERMVPINDETFELIKTLQKKACAFYKTKRQPTLLLRHGPSGSNVRSDLRLSLHWLCREIGIKDRVNSHRLRHTYATSLLNGGMSLVGVMKLLGHHSMQMTLIYAAVSPETVRNEYLAAIEKIEDRCHLQAAIETIAAEHRPTINNTFSDLIRLIQSSAQRDGGPDNESKKALIKRLRHLKDETAKIL